MPLQIIRQDITKMEVDAIVNAANSSLLGGGGVDGCIHRAAGPELLKECKALGGCDTGNSKITGAYDLPCKYVIHTVGPRYKDGCHGEKALLESCYSTSLVVAKEHNCETVAFPLISSGIYGYPGGEALKVATDVISEFLLENDMTVYIVIFDKNSFEISGKLFADIEAFIDDNYVDLQETRFPERRDGCFSAPQAETLDGGMMPRMAPPAVKALRVFDDEESTKKKRKSLFGKKSKNEEDKQDVSFTLAMGVDELPAMSLEDVINQIDESFSEMLLRKIDEKGMKDSECYKKANIDRKLFSKIRSDVNYRPSKPTVIAFAIALELSLAETKDMLMKAGFALSHSNKFDLIIEFFISKGIYDVFEINEALFAFDQSLLGA